MKKGPPLGRASTSASTVVLLDELKLKNSFNIKVVHSDHIIDKVSYFYLLKTHKWTLARLTPHEFSLKLSINCNVLVWSLAPVSWLQS